jgi:hypothetical protein
VINCVRNNQVMSNLMGFDCNATMVGRYFNTSNGYGIPAELDFNFCFWYLNKGKELRRDIEPPHWDILINRLNPFTGTGFDFNSLKPSKTPKAGFNYEQWNRAGEKLRDLLYVPGKKESIAEGIDRYNGEHIIFYNPERPPYWVPVTIREVFGLMIEFYRLYPDQGVSDMIVKMLTDDFALYSEQERDSYAYFGGRSPTARVGTDNTQNPVMRVNTDYWNKNLPRSAIQIFSFNCPADKNFIRKEKEEQLKNNSEQYHITRFVEALDTGTFVPLIDK